MQALLTTPLKVELLIDGGRGALIIISRKDTHWAKALPPIFLIAAGNSRRFKALHSRNEELPIVVHAAGIAIFTREAHFSNALSPIDVTEMGRLMVVSEAHCEKALSPMLLTDTGSMTIRRE